MAGSTISSCLRVGARLLLLRLLYLWYVNYPAMLEFYQQSPLYEKLIDVGVPEYVVNYPCSGLGNVNSRSLALELIVAAIKFVDAFSANLALSVYSVTNPPDNHPPPKGFLSLLTFIGKGLRPIWMRMHYITLVIWVADRESLVDHIFPGWVIVTPELAVCYAFLPFVLFAFLWVAYVAIETLWRETLWHVAYIVSTRMAVRGLIAQCALLLVVLARIVGWHVPSFDIVLFATDFFGWPVPSVGIENYHRIEATQAILRRALETCYSWYSLFDNGRGLTDIVFL